MQEQMIISPAIFREFFKPRYAKLYSKWKSINPQLKLPITPTATSTRSSVILLRLGWTS